MNVKKHDIRPPHTEIPAFRGLDKAATDRLLTDAGEHVFPKGKILLINGDRTDRYFYIKSGWIKLFRETLDGTEAVVDILSAGHMFGETSVFENDICPYSAEIVEAAAIVSLSLPRLKEEIETSAQLALSMLTSMARYRRQQDKEIEHRSLQNASQRIGCFLLRLADQKRTGPVTIHLPYDKTLVAARLGMQPETFSRALAKLKNTAGIRIKGATIEFDDLTRLADYSCAACSSDFPCKDL